MLSKTVAEWRKETEHYAVIFYERYVQSFDDRNCSPSTGSAYCALAKNNFDLRDVLVHIETYGSLHTPEQRAGCKHNDVNHNQKLNQTYNKYKKWIDIAIVNSEKAKRN